MNIKNLKETTFCLPFQSYFELLILVFKKRFLCIRFVHFREKEMEETFSICQYLLQHYSMVGIPNTKPILTVETFT